MTRPHDPEYGRTDPDSVADEADEESFPASDPPATWAGADEPSPPDRAG